MQVSDPADGDYLVGSLAAKHLHCQDPLFLWLTPPPNLRSLRTILRWLEGGVPSRLIDEQSVDLEATFVLRLRTDVPRSRSAAHFEHGIISLTLERVQVPVLALRTDRPASPRGNRAARDPEVTHDNCGAALRTSDARTPMPDDR